MKIKIEKTEKFDLNNFTIPNKILKEIDEETEKMEENESNQSKEYSASHESV